MLDYIKVVKHRNLHDSWNRLGHGVAELDFRQAFEVDLRTQIQEAQILTHQVGRCESDCDRSSLAINQAVRCEREISHEVGGRIPRETGIGRIQAQ